MRLFIAVNFDENIKNSLKSGIAAFKAAGASGNFTSDGNLHLTLVFIGETDRVKDVEKCMDGVQAKPFELTVGGCGKFERKGEDIRWIGVKKSAELSSVHKQLADSLTDAGFDIEKRPFSPHITLGRRVKTPVEPDLSAVGGSMTVSCIRLMKSERINGVLRYSPVYVKRF